MRVRENPDVIFMNATLVAKIPKNKLEEIRVSVLRNNKIDLRTYFYFPNETEPKPTRKGIWLSYKHMPQIIGAFEKHAADPKSGFSLEFESRENEKIRVYLGEFKGAKIVHMRNFYLKENEYLPGKGISFAVPLIAPMLEALKNLPKSA